MVGSPVACTPIPCRYFAEVVPVTVTTFLSKRSCGPLIWASNEPTVNVVVNVAVKNATNTIATNPHRIVSERETQCRGTSSWVAVSVSPAKINA